jgi:hypothetical protein
MHMIVIFKLTFDGLHWSEILINNWRAALGRNCNVNFGRAASESCGATCNLVTDSAIFLGPKE